jgi:hypothetical protein
MTNPKRLAEYRAALRNRIARAASGEGHPEGAIGVSQDLFESHGQSFIKKVRKALESNCWLVKPFGEDEFVTYGCVGHPHLIGLEIDWEAYKGTPEESLAIAKMLGAAKP